MSTWSQTTKQIYNGVLIYSLCGVAKSIVDPIVNATSAMSMLTGGSSSSFNFGTVLSIAIIFGYVYFFLGLKKFRTVVDAADESAVKKVYLAVLLNIIAYVVALIPLMGIIGKIISIVAFIYMMIGFAGMKNSSTFPVKARKGASNLFVAMILSIVGTVLGWLPLIGGVIGAIPNIISFILIIVGWKKISKAEEISYNKANNQIEF